MYSVTTATEELPVTTALTDVSRNVQRSRVMFASKTPRDLSHDPHPFVGEPGHTNTPNRYGFRETGEGAPFFDTVTYDPRPEFDHGQHNVPNPILVALRERLSFSRRPRTTTVLEMWAMLTPGYRYYRDDAVDAATPEQIGHARRVLTLVVSQWDTTA